MNMKTPTIGSYTDDEEKELIDSIENAPADQYQSVMTNSKKTELQAIAKNSIDTGREKISLRVPKMDLVKLREKAKKEGMPYQTLINSILHKAANDR